MELWGSLGRRQATALGIVYPRSHRSLITCISTLWLLFFTIYMLSWKALALLCLLFMSDVFLLVGSVFAHDVWPHTTWAYMKSALLGFGATTLDGVMQHEFASQCAV